uniref:hypothetical protein n=1 Tax=Leucobacter chironomi TaxID=491918 RepID=UPI00055F0AE0
MVNDNTVDALARLLASGVDLAELERLAALVAPTYTPALVEVERVERPSLSRGGASPAKAHQGAFPPDHAGEILMDEEAWIAHRDRVLLPTTHSNLVTTEQTRREFLEGARLLRFDGDRAIGGR